ncbi:MAG: hypothetical protein R2941_11110 [Desulfobacterales bacterium]
MILPESYLRDAQGNPVYSGKADIDGVSYNPVLQHSPIRSRRNKIFYMGSPIFRIHPAVGRSGVASLMIITKTSPVHPITAPQTSESGGSGQVADTDSGWYTADLESSL